MPLRIGAQVRVYEGDDSWFGIVVRRLSRERYRVREIGTPDVHELWEEDMEPILPNQGGPGRHQFNTGRDVGTDESLCFPMYASLLIGAGTAASGSATASAAASTAGADPSKGTIDRPAGSEGAKSSFKARMALKTMSIRSVIGGNHGAEYTENCAMVTAAAVITYASDFHLRLNSGDVATRIARLINTRIAMAPRAASAVAGPAPVSALNQSGLRFTDLALFAYPDSPQSRSIGSGTALDLMNGPGLAAHLIGFQLFCVLILRPYGLRTDFCGTATNMVPLIEIKRWMRRIGEHNQDAVFGVYSGGHWNFAGFDVDGPYFIDYQRDHSGNRPPAARSFIPAMRFTRDEPATPGGVMNRMGKRPPTIATGSAAAAAASVSAPSHASLTDFERRGVAFAFF